MDAEYTPMNINEAIEVMKIIAPYAGDMAEGESGKEVLDALISGFERDGTEENALRLLALMQHETLDEVVDQLQGASGAEYLSKLVNVFNINNVRDLIGAAGVLGLTQQRDSDASR
jgi:hypothetical protein